MSPRADQLDQHLQAKRDEQKEGYLFLRHYRRVARIGLRYHLWSEATARHGRGRSARRTHPGRPCADPGRNRNGKGNDCRTGAYGSGNKNRLAGAIPGPGGQEDPTCPGSSKGRSATLRRGSRL